MSEEKSRVSGEVPRAESSSPVLPTVNPAAEKPQPPKSVVHPAFYVIVWIGFSSSVILFNKWVLDTLNFRYPVILTTLPTWPLRLFATQLMARFTPLLDGRKTVKMTGSVYLRAVVPIGLFFPFES
ncbi:hypothetical protein J3459_018582 [Metarhizium acridum]|nr:hypothetical protein J3459_018582 [Metarhizium acridum]